MLGVVLSRCEAWSHVGSRQLRSWIIEIHFTCSVCTVWLFVVYDVLIYMMIPSKQLYDMKRVLPVLEQPVVILTFVPGKREASGYLSSPSHDFSIISTLYITKAYIINWLKNIITTLRISLVLEHWKFVVAKVEEHHWTRSWCWWEQLAMLVTIFFVPNFHLQDSSLSSEPLLMKLWAKVMLHMWSEPEKLIFCKSLRKFFFFFNFI